MESVDQALLQATRAGQGKPGKHATVQSKGNRGHCSQHGYAKRAANPLLTSQSTLHGGEDTAAGEQGDRQRSRSSRRIAEQEYDGMGACALQGCSGKNEA